MGLFISSAETGPSQNMTVTYLYASPFLSEQMKPPEAFDPSPLPWLCPLNAAPFLLHGLLHVPMVTLSRQPSTHSSLRPLPHLQ